MKKELLLVELLEETRKKYPLIKGIAIDPHDVIFEERVKMSCFYCARYNTNWKCPPKIPQLDYQKMLQEYNQAAFVWIEMPLTKETYDDVRSESSLMLHKALLSMEEYLMYRNNAMALSFIGGSCKLCKNGCGKEQCNNPYKARTPLEAIGVNIISSAEKYGITVSFPPGEFMMRLGLLLW